MNTRKLINVILDAVVTLHLTYASIVMCRAAIPKEVLPIDTAYGKKFKYLTFWNVCIEALYFLYAVIENIASGFVDNEDKPLRKIRDYWFMSIVFPLSAFVSVTFWTLWAVDRELVMPKAVDPYFPTWLNHSVHTCILIYSLLELFTTYHKANEPVIRICYGLWVVTVTYLIWCVFVWYKCQLWVYPVLEVLNWPGKIAFFSSCLLMATVFLYIGYYINKFTWGNNMQIKSMKKQR